ncbi:MAG: VWA domain-containing protein [Treponema sp.]|jgi:Ca-activated chloride channel family protein|nr:VWA domain-containing protein [Treponema sp.]
MSFDTPLCLTGFALYIPLIILAVLDYRNRGPFLKLVVASGGSAGDPVHRQRLLRELQGRFAAASLCEGIFLACLIIALAGPRWGKRSVLEYRQGVDVIFALDVSRSMQVRDIPGFAPEGIARLDRALRIARDVAEDSGAIRLGAAIGKGRGVLAVPLTYDTGALVSFLEGLSGSSITGRGTNLETLINAASSGFQDAFPTSRELILFSDGESLSGSLTAALDRVLDQGIRISAVGLGTEQGGPVPLESFPGLDLPSAEEPPMSYRQSERLRNATERTGGIYVDGNREDAAMLLLNHIRSYTLESKIQDRPGETQERWRLFVLVALVSLGASKGLVKRRRRHG